MKFILILALLCVGASAQTFDLKTDCGRGTNSLSKIVGGTQAAAGDWGWQIAFKVLNILACGGSLINENWIVTAAHCIVYGPELHFTYSVDIGYNDRTNADTWSIERKISKVIVHPLYNDNNYSNDIALMKLDSPVVFDTVNYRITPACIPDGSEDYSDRTGWVTGFGTLFSGGLVSHVLRQVQLPVKSEEFCSNRFPKTNPLTQVCAGVSGLGKDTCQGDSGGPLVVKSRTDGRWHLVGLTSFGPNPCGEGGVYTRLSGFGNWIIETMAANVHDDIDDEE